MKKCSKCSIVKDFVEFHKCKREKDGRRSICKQCRKKHQQENKKSISKYQKEYRLKNKDKLSKKRKIYYEQNKDNILNLTNNYKKENKDKISQKNKELYLKNKDKKLKYQKTYYEENKNTIIEKTKKYKKNNKDKVSAQSAKRRAKKLNATLEGYDNEIKEIYKNCPEGYEVDHIFPLQNPKLCGLHVPWNLQYLTREENRSKYNKIPKGERND